MRRFLQRAALYAFHLGFARPIMHWVVGIRYRRRRLVPEGPCLVVANHNSHLDAAALLTMFPLSRLAHVHPVAAADYFDKNWLMRTMAMVFMNAIPIKRRPSRGEDPLSPLVEALRAGESLIFFPEGSRGEAGVVAPFRRGVGLLIRETPGLLVVPVFLSGPERMWPRGEIVPVPLSADANIGRPRTYDANEDARVLADKVRDDVLALAPPPPPVPGQGPQPPLRVAVCSIDTEARVETFRAITGALGRLGPTLGVGSAVLQADEEGLRETNGPVAVGRRRAWLRLLAWLFRVRGRFNGRRFVGFIERAQLDEALDHGAGARFVVLQEPALVELLAADPPAADEDLAAVQSYLTGGAEIPFDAWWRFIRHRPALWLVGIFDLVQTPRPDVVVHLRCPVDRVMTSLRSRGVALEPFQNARSLEELQESYTRVGRFLAEQDGVEFLEIDTEAESLSRTVERVRSLCQGLAQRAS